MLDALLAACLVVLTVAIHAAGFSALLHATMRWHALAKSGFLPVTRLVIGLTCWLLLIHGVEIAGAPARTARGIDGHPHVRALDRALLRVRLAVDQQLHAQESRAGS